MKGQKINVNAVLAAAGSGLIYNAAIEAASRRVAFIQNNYLVAKSAGAALLGTAMLYFGKSETVKAAGYGLLGVGAAAGASKIATMLTAGGSAEDTAVQGIRRKLTPGSSKSIRKALEIARGNVAARKLQRPMIAVKGGQPIMNVEADRSADRYSWLNELPGADY